MILNNDESQKSNGKRKKTQGPQTYYSGPLILAFKPARASTLSTENTTLAALSFEHTTHFASFFHN